MSPTIAPNASQARLILIGTALLLTLGMGIRQSFGHFYTAYEAALAGDGLLVAPTVLAAEDVRNGRLAVVEPDIRIQGARHMLLWRKADEAATALIALLEWLRKEIGPHQRLS